MIGLSHEAEAQLDPLIAPYEALGRVEASIHLLHALERARERISRRPEAGWRRRVLIPRLRSRASLDHRRQLLDFVQFNVSSGHLRRFLRDVGHSQSTLKAIGATAN